MTQRLKNLLLALLLTGVVALLLLLSYYFLHHLNFQQYLIRYLPNGPLGTVSLFIALLLATAIGLPRQVAAFCSGFLLNVFSGALIATLAATGGCMLTYCFSRRFLSTYVTQKYPQATKKTQRFLGQDTFLKTLVIRFIPAGNNLITNILAGICQIPRKQFFIGSAIGFLPQMFIFSMMGNGLKVADKYQVLLSLCLMVVAAGISYTLYYRHKKRNLSSF